MNLFDSIRVGKKKSSNFNLSEESKLSMKIGDLVPILVKETLPGDSFKINTELLIKFAPMKAPVMHRLKAYVHYFYVPNFQLTNLFEKFVNPKVNKDNSVLLPYVGVDYLVTKDILSATGSDNIGSLADYMGLPIMNEGWLSPDDASLSSNLISVLPFMAYQHIYNSYFRDQNMELLSSEGADVSTSSLFDLENYKDVDLFSALPDKQLENLFTLRKRAWKKDYFTSALPSPQAGDDVLIPMSETVDFFRTGDTIDEHTPPISRMEVSASSNSGSSSVKLTVDDDDYENEWTIAGKVVNTSASINDLRRAMAYQRVKELSERGGTRLKEFLANFWDERINDYYVDRPIYLGGQLCPINIGEVVQTSQTTDSSSAGSNWSAQGTRAGIANGYGFTKGVKFHAPMYGFVIGLLSIRPDASYEQGLERMWTRKSIFDYALPQFANLGEQEIHNYEIFANGDSDDVKVFGYTPRYAEYKEGHCHVLGEFRNSLRYWHFGRKFDNLPTLSKEFVMMDSVSKEPFNVTASETEEVYVNLYNNIYARRKLPYYGTPSIL